MTDHNHLRELPPHTRLILASEDLLERFGTRTEDGYRITAEWGEQKPEGWYEPTFTVHHDDRLALDENDRLREALRGLALYEDSDGASCWCNANPDQVHVEWCVAARGALESSGGPDDA